jgi:large subunit ribosomal protein L16
MLQPKRTSFRKMHKGRVSGTKKHTLHFGSFGLQACSAGRLKASVIEAMRRVMTRKLKRQGQIWIRVFPDIAVSEKPAEVRMVLHHIGFAVYKKDKYYLNLMVFQNL